MANEPTAEKQDHRHQHFARRASICLAPLIAATPSGKHQQVRHMNTRKMA